MKRSRWRKRLLRLLVDEQGPTAVEYAILLALILLVLIQGVRGIGTVTAESFENSNNLMFPD